MNTETKSMRTDQLKILQLFKITEGSLPSLDLSEYKCNPNEAKIIIKLAGKLSASNQLKNKMLQDRRNILAKYTLAGDLNWSILHSSFEQAFLQEYDAINESAQATLQKLLNKYKENHTKQVINLLSGIANEPSLAKYCTKYSGNLEQLAEYVVTAITPSKQELKTWSYSLFRPIGIDQLYDIWGIGAELIINQIISPALNNLIDDVFNLSGSIGKHFEKRYSSRKDSPNRVNTLLQSCKEQLEYRIPYLQAFNDEIAEDLISFASFALHIEELPESHVSQELQELKKKWSAYLAEQGSLTTPGERAMAVWILPDDLPNPLSKGIFQQHWSNPESLKKYKKQLLTFANN